MKNEFIPYEEALALKELGFDEECFGCYTKDKELSLDYSDNKGEGHYFQDCSAPLYQQAFRWFRDEFQLIKQDYMFSQVEDYYAFIIYSSINGNIYDCCYNDKEEISGFGFKLYEEAELACLRKLIEFNVGIIRIRLLKPKEDE